MSNQGEEDDYVQNDSAKWAKNAYGQKTGKFSKEESETVRKAVEEFCTLKEISVARLCSECDHKAELKGAWMEIAKQLPHRSVQSVYRHGLRQLHPFKRGAWTDEECELLVNLVQRTGKKWASIQQKLNRSADSCRDKYREMNDDYVRGRWKENETETLKKLIRDHLDADPNADIKMLGKMVENEGIKIPWSIISKRMGKRSRLSCFKKWQKMTGLYAASDPYKKAIAADKQPQDVDDVKAGHAAATNVAVAAAAHLAVLPNPVPPSHQQTTDYDTFLLSELAQLNVTRASEINWDLIRLEGAEERWNELVEEWQTSNVIDDSILSMPLSEIAQFMLERKTPAQRAAETVEAVDLPPPEALSTREV
ncbi:unnamed protein product [Cylindrotheca closterium]|uniref:Uncharacterized protein n=1 Tax=Cylindrotheca closterium TaxID=2856 RepID=A0AAD2G9S0_9STRA|nr:unnamed protein product [Cylindrotheca closterium]